MADRGITFSAPMVCALLDGRKTQTRRLLPTKQQAAKAPFQKALPSGRIGWYVDVRHKFGPNQIVVAPLVGDRLYVREHWKTTPAYDDLATRDMGGEEPLRYLADDATLNWAEADGERFGRRRQALHMPRWASRLTLLVTDVRVQRLGDMSDADAMAEGIHAVGGRHGWSADGENWFASPKIAFQDLWNSLHTDPGARWDDNPWIYAVSFDVRRGNIDNLEGSD